LDEYAVRFYLLLDYVLKITAEEQYQRIVVAMAPHLKKEERTKIINSYLDIASDKDVVTSDIIGRDRERLKRLLSQSKWQKRQK
jgi:hypothetical protein